MLVLSHCKTRTCLQVRHLDVQSVARFLFEADKLQRFDGSLSSICENFRLIRSRKHTGIQDVLLTIEVYRNLFDIIKETYPSKWWAGTYRTNPTHNLKNLIYFCIVWSSTYLLDLHSKKEGYGSTATIAFSSPCWSHLLVCEFVCEKLSKICQNMENR